MEIDIIWLWVLFNIGVALVQAAVTIVLAAWLLDVRIRWELTPRGIRKIGQKALRDIFQHLRRDSFGRHDTRHRGGGGEPPQAAVAEPGEVEEGEQVVVADVEEEVVRARVVAVLEDLRQRELQHALVELDGPPDVGAQQREVVQTASRAGRPVGQ